MTEMTKEVIVAACKANGGYASPALNDQLYLHCKGFVAVQNLEPYVNVKVLWLEQNALSDLRGLATLQNLVSLFVQNNAIRSLETFATSLPNLRVLNISHNYLTSLRGLDTACPGLETLQASHNLISSLHACQTLWRLSGTLTSVDLSFNKIEHDEEVVPDDTSVTPTQGDVAELNDDVRVVPVDAAVTPARESNARDPLVLVRFFSRLPLVSVVYFHGNALAHGLRHYRRNMILHLSSLTYLDERPVFAEERRVVEAWGRAGAEGESAERAAIQAEKRAHLNSCVGVLTASMTEHRALRERLTQQWDRQREEELRARQLRRSCDKEEREACTAAEQHARDALEKEEQNARWDIEEVFASAHEEQVRLEVVRQREREQALEEQRVRDDVLRELAEADDTTLQDLVMTDDEVLCEMEQEIQSVLHDVGGYVAHHAKAAPQQAPPAANQPSSELAAAALLPPAASHVHERAALRAERATHAAFARLSDRLREERQRHEAHCNTLWQRFEHWERPSH